MKPRFNRYFLPIVLALFLASCSNENEPQPTITTDTTLVTVYNYTPEELELIRIINDYRTSNELNELQVINHISYKCQEHNNYMIRNNMLNHNNFTARANNLIQVLGAITVGENIAYNFSTPAAVLNAWLNNPEHRQNLDGNYTHMGLSVSTNAEGKKYYTNIFIRK